MYVHTSAKGVGFNDPLQCPETASLVNSAGRLHKPFLHIPPSSQNSPAPLKKRPSPKENARHPIGGKSGQQGFNKRERLGRGKGEAWEGEPFWRKVPLPPSKPPPFPSQDFWLYRIPLVRSGEDLLFIFVRRIIGKGAYWSLSVFLLYWNYM